LTELTGNIINYFIRANYSPGKRINLVMRRMLVCCCILATFAITGQQLSAQTINFGLVKSQAYPSPPAPGNLVSYTITYMNTSQVIATNVIIIDTLPPAALFTYNTSDHSGTYNPGVRSVVWNIGNVVPNGSGSVTVSGYWGQSGTAYLYNPSSYYTSAGSSVSSITNRARIFSDQSPLGFSAPPVTAIVPQTCGSEFPDGDNSYRQGENKIVYYPLSIVNRGNIFDNFILFVPPSVLSQTGSELLIRILDINKNPITQSGWIPPNGTFTFFLELDGTSTGLKPKNGDIFNITVTSTSRVCNTISSSTLTTTTYNGHPSNLQDIIVTKTSSAGSYTVGSGPITYTIIMSNIGQSNATGVVLTDYLPANAPLPVPSSINPPGAISGNRVTWPAININAGEILPPYTIIIYPTCLSVPALINTAVATATGDVNPANNTSTITIPVTYNSVIPVPSTGTPVICSNNSVVLSATGASGPNQTYRWYTTATGTIPFAQGSPVTSQILTSNTTFYVSVFNTATLCESNRSSITIIVNPLPDAAGAITGATALCSGHTIVNYSVPLINNATSYTWSYTGSGATITGSGNTISIDFSAAATSGVLTVLGHSFCGNGIPSHINITITPLPSTSAIYHQ
jgi:uncharacterized repeat protein (TIGR01451 family)